MEKLLALVKENKGAILKGALITIGSVAVVALAKAGLEGLEDNSSLVNIGDETWKVYGNETLVEDLETEEEEA